MKTFQIETFLSVLFAVIITRIRRYVANLTEIQQKKTVIEAILLIRQYLKRWEKGTKLDYIYLFAIKSAPSKGTDSWPAEGKRSLTAPFAMDTTQEEFFYGNFSWYASGRTVSGSIRRSGQTDRTKIYH
jgi:hypothetical protein